MTKTFFFCFYFDVAWVLKVTKWILWFSNSKSTGYCSLVSDTKHISFVVFSTAWRLIQKSIANIFNFFFNALWFNSNNYIASILNIFTNGASIVLAERGLTCWNNARAAYETKDHFWQKHFSSFFGLKIFLILNNYSTQL